MITNHGSNHQKRARDLGVIDDGKSEILISVERKKTDMLESSTMSDLRAVMAESELQIVAGHRDRRILSESSQDPCN